MLEASSAAATAPGAQATAPAAQPGSADGAAPEQNQDQDQPAKAGADGAAPGSTEQAQEQSQVSFGLSRASTAKLSRQRRAGLIYDWTSRLVHPSCADEAASEQHEPAKAEGDAAAPSSTEQAQSQPQVHSAPAGLA